MNHGNKKKMETGGSFDKSAFEEKLRAYELSLLDKTRVPDEEDMPKMAKGGALSKKELMLNIYEPTGDYFLEKKDGKIILHLTSKDASNLPPSFFEKFNVEDNGKGYYGASYIVSKKFAKGGTLELDPKQAKKAFHLPIEMAIYVPSTSDVDKAISDSEMKKRVTEVSTYLSNIFGGYTSQETIGGYVDSKGNLVNEDVVRVVSFGATDKFEKNKAKILNKIAEWCSKWSQEAIGFEVEGDLYYIPENFAKGGNIRRYYNADPRMITAKFDTTCAETGKPIKKGESCIYYPKTKQCYSLSSKQAKEFREYMSDLDMGYNYAKGGNVRKYANGGSVFYIPYTTEISFKHKDDMDGTRRVYTFTKQIDSAKTFEEARTIAEEDIEMSWFTYQGYEGYDKDDISEIEVDDFYLGMPEEDDEKKFRGEVGIEENDEMLPEIERSGRWGDEYALLCDELANYKMGGRIKNALKKRFGKSKRGDVEIMDVEEIQESNNPQDMMQTLNYDPQMILSALKEAKDLAPETARSLDLYMASQIRNKQKFSDFLNATPNELLGRRFALGGYIKNKVRDDVFLLTSQRYIKDSFSNTYETKTYYQNETEILSKRVANRLVQILKERNITPSHITDEWYKQEIEYKIPLSDDRDGFILLNLTSHSINKRLSQLDLQDMIEDWNNKYGFRNLYAKGGDIKEDVLEVSNQLANASKMHKQQSQELKRLSKKMAKGGGVSKMSYDEFIETLRPYQIEGGFGSTLKKGMKMYYLKSKHPLFNKNFDHQNKRKAYKEYVDFISQDGNERFREPRGYNKGGKISDTLRTYIKEQKINNVLDADKHVNFDEIYAKDYPNLESLLESIDHKDSLVYGIKGGVTNAELDKVAKLLISQDAYGYVERYDRGGANSSEFTIYSNDNGNKKGKYTNILKGLDKIFAKRKGSYDFDIVDGIIPLRQYANHEISSTEDLEGLKVYNLHTERTGYINDEIDIKWRSSK